MLNYSILQEFEKIIIYSETNLKGIITNVSEAFCNISGYERAELIGKPHNIIRDPSNHPDIFKNLWESLQNGESYTIEQLSNKRKDGSVYYTKAQFAPIFDQNHETIIGYRSIREDITDLVLSRIQNTLHKANVLSTKQSNESLKKTLKEKEASLSAFKNDFISLFTHELKTPLNAIINFSDFISRIINKKEINEKQLEKINTLAQKINQSGLQQERMINNLLEFAHIQSGKLEVNKKYFKISNVLVPLINNLKEMYNKEVTYNLDDEFYIYSDPKICEMLFTNLYSNALKYAKSKVHITCEIPRENYFRLIVEDDGEGISDENKTKVFNFFTQSNEKSVLKMEKNSTGIGLYTVKLLADISDKKILLEDSKTLGGAKFIIEGEKSQ